MVDCMGTALWNTENASLFADAADTPLPCADALWVSSLAFAYTRQYTRQSKLTVLSFTTLERFDRTPLAVRLSTCYRSSRVANDFLGYPSRLFLRTSRLGALTRPLEKRVCPRNCSRGSTRSRVDSGAREVDREELDERL